MFESVAIEYITSICYHHILLILVDYHPTCSYLFTSVHIIEKNANQTSLCLYPISSKAIVVSKCIFMSLAFLVNIFYIWYKIKHINCTLTREWVF
ncbi:VIN3-like protein 2 [Iris pallida]|uniref:VIN3-like protein 2 n=1 Tax=Iris pallida TaxID=29817 RepID=A0AAX6FRF1_IRIPA|nr:VIN3-like protein 2 [Iris pallida]KAJ6833504.1 VIN3-like protein 2 [Iris pallida]